MLMVDRIVELETMERAVGIKCVSVNEPYFQGHYPEYPILPGVLIIEGMAQVAGVAFADGEEVRGKLPLLAAVEKAKFRRPVVPGDQLRIETRVVKARRGIARIEGKATVDGVLVAEAELMFTIVDKDRV